MRITDEPRSTSSVLAGLVNTRFVAALGAAGVSAVGLTGADASIGRVQPAGRHVSASGISVDLGRVGEPVGKEEPALLTALCRKGFVPVVASIGASREGRLFNVNADTLAAHLAGRLKSPRLIFAGATAGVLDGGGATIARMTLGGIEALIAGGGATAGMIAKLTACRSAVDGGTREVFVADGLDLAGLSLLARHGLKAGVAKCTRIVAQGAPRSESRGTGRGAHAIKGLKVS